MELKRWDTMEVIFSGEFRTRKEMVEAAVRQGADLSGADLFGADLSRADLSRANLSRANLSGADLFGADLFGASIIWNKYVCCLSWEDKGKTVCIRIGCKCHPVEDYKQIAEELATENDREWWDKSGKFIFEFLVGEAERYGKVKP